MKYGVIINKVKTTHCICTKYKRIVFKVKDGKEGEDEST